MKSSAFRGGKSILVSTMAVAVAVVPVRGEDAAIDRVFREDRGELTTDMAADAVIINVVEDMKRPISRFITGTGMPYHFVALRVDRFPVAEGSPTPEELIRKLGITMLRFPHGLYGQTYFWDNDDWTYEATNRGYARECRKDWWHTDDFIGFCRRLGIEPLLQVNTQTLYDPQLKRTRVFRQVSDGGKPEDWLAAARRVKTPSPQMLRSIEIMADYAAKWVQYVNVEKKYGVRYWEIGNEDWDNPYLYRHVVEIFSRKMRQVDPSIVLIAQYLVPIFAAWAKGRWAFDHAEWESQAYAYGGWVDYLAVHRYWAGIKELPTESRLKGTIAGGWSDAAVRAVRPLKPVALTEWNTAEVSMNVFRHTHADALTAASRLNALVRDDVKIGIVHDLMKYAWGLLWQRTTPSGTVWRQMPTSRAFELFNRHRGTHLVTYGQTGAASNYIVMKDKKRLLVIYVNAQPQPVSIDLDVGALAKIGQEHAVLTTLTGKVLLGDEYEKWFTLGQPRPGNRIEKLLDEHPERIEEQQMKVSGKGSFHFDLPAWTVGYLSVPGKQDIPSGQGSDR